MKSIYVDEPYVTKFKISSNDLDIIEYLKVKYSAKQIGISANEYCEIIIEKKNDKTHVFFEKKEYITTKPLAFVCNLMYTNREFDNDFFVVHGAAIEHNGKASIFLAETHAGKSTLTAFLTLNGFGYISDDCIHINMSSLQVNPYSVVMPMLLREGGYELIRNMGYSFDNIKKLEYPPFTRYAYVPSKHITNPLEISNIYFIERINNGNFITNMSQTDSMLSLLKSPMIQYKLNGTYIKFLKELSRIPCKKLQYSSLDYVLRIIKNEE